MREDRATSTVVDAGRYEAHRDEPHDDRPSASDLAWAGWHREPGTPGTPRVTWRGDLAGGPR